MKSPTNYGWRYPSLGEPKPKPGTEVLLIKANRSHGVGVWSDDCIAWAVRDARDRKKAKPNSLPVDLTGRTFLTKESA